MDATSHLVVFEHGVESQGTLDALTGCRFAWIVKENVEANPLFVVPYVSPSAGRPPFRGLGWCSGHGEGSGLGTKGVSAEPRDEE